MSNSKISVIVPVYNVEHNLVRCIDSILAQTFTDFEILLIDDGSTDASGKICDEYALKDSRIKVFHKTNGGVSSARNIGLDNAVGEWITFCDSDDWVDPQWLSTFINDIDIDADIIVQGFYLHKNSSEYYDKICMDESYYDLKNYNDYNKYLNQLNEINNTGYLWCRLFRRKTIINNNIAFNTRYALWEDLNFIFEFLVHSNKCYIKNGTYYHYTKPDFHGKYKKIQYTINTLDCLYSIINNYIAMAGYNKTPLLISLINQYINCLIHIYCKKNQELSTITQYQKFIKIVISNSSCIDYLSTRSKFFLYLDCISYKYLWQILNKLSSLVHR